MKEKKKIFIFYIIVSLIPFLFLSIAYISYTAYRSSHLYSRMKTHKRGWKGHLHKTNTHLGFSPVPNSYGAQVFPDRPDIPIHYDKDSFRVPVDDDKKILKHPRPLILALGCSFTFGDAVYAKDTYPYLVGQSLQGTSKNAGVCGYGLTQMFLLAKKLVPIYKPDYLLVQYSPWLVDRAQSPFAPTFYGKLPTPFFYKKNGKFNIQSPIFLTILTRLEVDKYRHTPTNLMDKLSFFRNVGLPLYFHDDINMVKYALEKSIGIIPHPTNNRTELTKYVYSQINNIAKKHGVKLVIVILGNKANPLNINNNLFPSDAIIANVQKVFLKYLSIKYGTVDEEDYKKEFMRYCHPNKAAHKYIADTILSAIRQADE